MRSRRAHSAGPVARHLLWSMTDTTPERVAALGARWQRSSASSAVRHRPGALNVLDIAGVELSLRGLRQARAARHRPGARGRRDRRPRRGRTTPASRRCAWWRPGSPRDRSAASSTGTVTHRRRPRWPASRYEFATQVGIGFQNPATQLSGRDRLGVRGGRARADEPRPDLRARPSTADEGCAGHPRHRAPGRARTAPAVGRTGAAGGHRLAACDAARRTSCSMSRPAQLDPEGTRLVGEALRDSPRPGRRSSSSSTRRTCSHGLHAGSWSSTDGRIAQGRHRAGDVLADPRLDRSCGSWSAPTRVRLWPGARPRARPRPGRAGPDEPEHDVAARSRASASSTRTGRARSTASTSPSSPASGRDRRPERQSASRPSSANSTACCGRPRADVIHDGVDVAPDAGRRSRRRGRARLPEPGSPDLRGQGRGRGGVRAEHRTDRSDRRGRCGGSGGAPAVGLTGLEDTNPYDLGFSKRKLLAIASILSMETPIVVLDEPTTGQDARGIGPRPGDRRRPGAEGRTVIAISHDLRFVAETFERVVVMR